MDKDIFRKIKQYLDKYLSMEIGRYTINCPYWMNKVSERKVVLRGFLDGKGEAADISCELNERWTKAIKSKETEDDLESLIKFAKRERIGIDCSGLVYRILDNLLILGYGNTRYSSLDEVFKGGISRTNARTITSPEYCLAVEDMDNIKLGDLIKINGGKHIAFIINKNKKSIIYIHSHPRTKTRGVHTGKINIINRDKPLSFQLWQEQTVGGENYSKKYFYSDKGDGVYRLKIFS